MAIDAIKAAKETAYPVTNNLEKGLYALSAASFVTLFVLNLLPLLNLYSPAQLAFINIGLTTFSYLTALGGGSLNGKKIGLVREILHFIPLFMVSLAGTGAFGSHSLTLSKMALGIVLTQAIANLYYFLSGCIAYSAKKAVAIGGQRVAVSSAQSLSAAKTAFGDTTVQPSEVRPLVETRTNYGSTPPEDRNPLATASAEMQTTAPTTVNPDDLL